MSVRIRLSRGGSKKRPYYHIVAADSRSPRDGRYIEKLGAYNPLLPQDNENRVVVDKEKVSAWLSKGAQPTERLQKIFANLGLCAAPTMASRHSARVYSLDGSTATSNRSVISLRPLR